MSVSPWMKSPLLPLLFLKTIYSQLLLFPRTQNQYHTRNQFQTSNHRPYNGPQILITQRKLSTVTATRKKKSISKQRNLRYPPPPLLLLLLLPLLLVLLPTSSHLLYLSFFTLHPSFASHLRPPSEPLTSRRSRISRNNHPNKHLNHPNPPNSISHKNYHPQKEEPLLSEKAYTKRLLSPPLRYHHNHPSHLKFLHHFLLFLPYPTSNHPNPPLPNRVSRTI